MMTRRNNLLGFVAGLMVLACVGAAQAALVSYWPLDGDAQAAVGTDGTLVNGPTAAADRFSTPGAAISFNGASQQYVSVPGGGGLNNLQEGTISMWVKWSGSQDPACCSSNGDVLGRQFNGIFSNNVIGLSTTDPATAKVTWQPYSTGVAMTGATAVGDGTWRHVLITYSSGSHTLYLDGTSDATGGTAGTIGNSPSVPLAIGAWIGDGSGYSTSVMDDVAVWNQKLSTGEIKLLANGSVGPADWAPSQPYHETVLADNPMAYYRFDGDSGLGGTQMTDSSGNNRHGTYNNNVSIEWDAPLASDSQAAHFDGTNRGAGTTDQPTTAVTVEAWARSDTELWNNTGMLVSKRSAFIIHPNQNTKSVNFYIFTTGWNAISFDLASIPGFDLRDWHQYVGVYDPTATNQLQFYVDGLLRATGNLTGAINSSTDYTYIGYDNAGARWFDGSIDEVAIYDHALSEGDIFRHFMGASFVPEPCVLAMLLGLGAAGLPIVIRRRRRN